MEIHINHINGDTSRLIPQGDVFIRDAFTGLMLISKSGETLGICLRDSGFELVYQGGSLKLDISLQNGRLVSVHEEFVGESETDNNINTIPVSAALANTVRKPN